MIEDKIRNNINKVLKPVFLNIINESKLHRAQGMETHFRLEIVSDTFRAQKRLDRHRIVQEILKDELPLIKAFSLHPFTTEEWAEKNGEFERSPACRGAHGS